MLCPRDPQAPALEQGTAPSLPVFRSSQLCLLYTLALKKQQMARLLLAPPRGLRHLGDGASATSHPAKYQRVTAIVRRVPAVTASAEMSNSPAGDRPEDGHG